MRVFERPVAWAIVGSGFGAAVSLINALSSEYLPIGAPLAGTLTQSVLKVLSLIVGVGWAWAALAVGIGWAVGKIVRGGLAGAVSLASATLAYYLADGALRGEPLVWYRSEIATWAIASLVLGPLLGAIGASIPRSGVIGLLAAAVVPIGAALQLALFGRTEGLTAEEVWARWLVWIAAAVAMVLVTGRFVRERRRDSKSYENVSGSI